MAAYSLAQAVSDAERENRLTPVAKRGVGQRRGNGAGQQAPTVQEFFEDSQARPQDRETLRGVAFVAQAVARTHRA